MSSNTRRKNEPLRKPNGGERLRREILSEKVCDLKINEKTTVGDLMRAYGAMGGFMAPNLKLAANMINEMKERGCTIFLSFTGNLMATGLRGVITQLIREGFVSAIVTTCGALDHDIARSYGARYCSGDFGLDDVMLNELKIHRLGNVVIPLEDYGPLVERVMREQLPEMIGERDSTSPSELASEFGKRIDDKNSFLRAAYEKNVPVYVPGVVDGSFGTNLFFYSQTKKFRLDLFKDMSAILNLVFDSKRTGAIIIGGGISKHHVIWWNQFREGLDYCVYLTTAQEYDGSLSGALPKEAISWGKVKPIAKQVAVFGDVTITLPLIAGSLIRRVGD